MKIKMLIAMFFLGSMVSLQAQDHQAAKSMATEQAKKKTSQMDQYLNLTDEQAAKVKEINESYFTKRQKVNDGKMSPEERKERMKGQLANYKQEVKAVLTPEQQERFEAKADELTKDMGARMDERREKRSEKQEQQVAPKKM